MSRIFARNAALTVAAVASSTHAFAVPFQLAKFVFHNGSESETPNQQDNVDKEQYAGDQAGDQQSSSHLNVTKGLEKGSSAQQAHEQDE